MLEVAQPAMDQLARSRRGGRCEIALFDQTDRQTATSGIAGDPDAIAAAAAIGCLPRRLFDELG